ncbi:MAG: hypothetical protein N2C14_18870 [Planctomycetales bacterium]
MLNSTRITRLHWMCAGAVGLLTLGASAGVNAQPVQEEIQGEALSRGPIHEAFAELYKLDPEPGVLVAKAPPEPIQELPPEQRLEGDDVQWIPGYWGWDDESEDYIWISGLWRKLPPRRRWVPGYWAEAEGGFRWVSGFWSDENERELNYLPNPPASLEQGANIAQDNDEQFWAPGGWSRRDDDYYWRAGQWSTAHDNWIWTPSRYVWTPHGCLHVNGYWDYRLPHRGVLYAPIHFSRRHYPRTSYYTPRIAVDVGPLLIHLFARPNYCHYYFGDYYGDRYAGYGIHPWHNYYHGSRRYCSLLSYYDSHYRRRGIDFHHRIRYWNDQYHDHHELRPPRTYAAQADYQRRHGTNRLASQAVFGRTVEQLASRENSTQRFRDLTSDDRKLAVQSTDQLRLLAKQRGSLKRTAATVVAKEGSKAPAAAQTQLLKLPQVVGVRRADYSRS